MTKQEWSEYMAGVALSEFRRVGLENFRTCVVDDLKRLSEGDYPGMCYDAIEAQPLYVRTGFENHFGLCLKSGENLPNQKLGAQLWNDEGVAVISVDFIIDGKRIILGDPW